MIGILCLYFFFSALLVTVGDNYRTVHAVSGEYIPAANQGNAEAQLMSKGIYSTGRYGMQNNALAAEWFHKAAEQDNSNAQYKLGISYMIGEGRAKDSNLAMQSGLTHEKLKL